MASLPSATAQLRLNSTGTTPFRTVPVSHKAIENKNVMNELLGQELRDVLFEVPFDKFMTAFFDPTLATDKKRYEDIALDCLDEMTVGERRKGKPEARKASRVQDVKSELESDTGETDGDEFGTYRWRSKRAKLTKKRPFSDSFGTKQWPNSSSEDAMYRRRAGNSSSFFQVEVATEKPHKLMERIRKFYRRKGVTGDEAWPIPVDLCSEPTYLKLDIAMLLLGSTGRLEDDDVYWKDVRVSFEVKKSNAFDIALVTQICRYSRAVKLDQFDRNISYTVVITANQCRALRWDSAACYLTTPLLYHENPATFIELIGRLASLDPISLGYDKAFSNAGLVTKGSWERMQTTPRIIPTLPRPLVEGDGTKIPPPPTTDPNHPNPKIYLLDRTPVTAAADLNFCRSTFVWGAHEIQNNVVQTRLIVIKQNHQDERRPHEGAFYQITNGFRSGRVARLMCSQELSHTREYHNREALGVLGYYVLRSSKSKAQSAGRRASTPERENDLEFSGDELEDEEGGKEGEGDISMEPIAQESEARISTSDAGGNDT
ncbi:hypothetical protein FRB96_003276 [Tulasnella sp. 330]|nr:hypothetical protein FRB96_003276 [Tulasnella sp. 330]